MHQIPQHRYVYTVENVRGKRTTYVGSYATDEHQAADMAVCFATSTMVETGVPFARKRPCRVVTLTMDVEPWGYATVYGPGEYQR